MTKSIGFQIVFQCNRCQTIDRFQWSPFIRWLLSRFRTLLLSAMKGFLFTVFAVLNSYIFQLDIFDMGLTQKQPKGFTTKRVYTILILEVFISSWNIRIFVKFLLHICIHRINLSWCFNVYFWYNQMEQMTELFNHESHFRLSPLVYLYWVWPWREPLILYKDILLLPWM